MGMNTAPQMSQLLLTYDQYIKLLTAVKVIHLCDKRNSIKSIKYSVKLYFKTIIIII